MSGTGLTLELLLQLFFVLEGLSLWKVSAPKMAQITDFDHNDKICDKILRGKGTSLQRIKLANDFLYASKWYKFFAPVTRFFCSFVPIVAFAIITIILFLYFDRQNEIILLPWMNTCTAVYFFVKLVFVGVTDYLAKRYDAAISAVSANESQVVEPQFS